MAGKQSKPKIKSKVVIVSILPSICRVWESPHVLSTSSSSFTITSEAPAEAGIEEAGSVCARPQYAHGHCQEVREAAPDSERTPPALASTVGTGRSSQNRESRVKLGPRIVTALAAAHTRALAICSLSSGVSNPQRRFHPHAGSRMAAAVLGLCNIQGRRGTSSLTLTKEERFLKRLLELELVT